MLRVRAIKNGKTEKMASWKIWTGKDPVISSLREASELNEYENIFPRKPMGTSELIIT